MLLTDNFVFSKKAKNRVKNYSNFFIKKFFLPISSPQTDPKGRIVVNGYVLAII
jgi:hypothetical protein